VTAVTSYTELIGAIRERIGELGIRYEDFDVLAGFAPGLSGKVFGPSQVRRLGPEKLFDALCAASLKITTEPDADQLAKMQKQMAEKCQVRQANQARMQNEASPAGTHRMGRFFRYFAKMGGKARMRKMTKAQRSKHGRHAATQRWIKHRKKLRAASRASRTRKDRLALMAPAHP
jgi:hypothetical protein